MWVEQLLSAVRREPLGLHMKWARWDALKSRGDNPAVRSFFEPYRLFQDSGLILWACR